MAHFAEIDSNNIVLRVLRVPDEEEHRGNDFLSTDLGLGGIWIQTSINTSAGNHSQGKEPLRKNFAMVGGLYDPDKDAFIPVKPYPSWLLDEVTCCWKAPVPPPTDDKLVFWNEESTSWTIIDN